MKWASALQWSKHIETLRVWKSIIWRWDYSPRICAAQVELIHTTSIAIKLIDLNCFKCNRHLGFLWLFDLNIVLGFCTGPSSNQITSLSSASIQYLKPFFLGFHLCLSPQHGKNGQKPQKWLDVCLNKKLEGNQHQCHWMEKKIPVQRKRNWAIAISWAKLLWIKGVLCYISEFSKHQSFRTLIFIAVGSKTRLSRVGSSRVPAQLINGQQLTKWHSIDLLQNLVICKQKTSMLVLQWAKKRTDWKRGRAVNFS